MTSINHSNNLCLVTLHFPPSTSCHCPDHVPPSELDKKFDKFDNLKNTSNNNPTNILTNLCSGLEKFLGFNPSSKGYNGSGIVYSDLDRLCDGVMGFLLKCLEGSKELLTHYNPEITETIEHLNNSIGKGLGVSGFASAIGKVKSGLQGYERVMEERIKEVKTPLETMQERFRQLETYLNNFSKKNLKTQLTHVSEQARLYWTEANGVALSSADLDDDLKKKLEPAVEAVKQASKTFRDVTQNSHVNTEATRVDTTLIEHVKHIKMALDYQTRNVQTALNNGYEAVQKSIDDLIKIRAAHMQAITRSVSDAKITVSDYVDNFDNEFKTPIREAFEEIIRKLSVVDSKKNQTQLRTDVDDIKKKLMAFGDKLSQHVQKLGIGIEAAENTRAMAEQKAGEAYDKLKEEDEVGKNVKSKLGEEIDNILKTRNNISLVNNKLIEQVTALGEWKLAAERDAEKAVKWCNAIVKALKPDKGMTFATRFPEITKKVTELNEAYTKTKQRLQEVTQLTKEANTKLGTIKDDVMSQLGADVSGALLALKETLKASKNVQKLVNHIKGLNNRDNKCLDIGGYTTSVHLSIDKITGSEVIEPWLKEVEKEIETPLIQAAQAGATALDGKIKSEVKITPLATVNDTVHKVDDGETKTKKGDIEHALNMVKLQMDEIAKKVEKNNDDDTIRGYLNHIQTGLGGTDRWTSNKAGDGQISGLQRINTAIGALQSTLSQQPTAIYNGVEGIKMQLLGARNALKSEKGQDVFFTLGDLKTKIGHVSNGDSPPADSLGELRVQLAELHASEYNQFGTILTAITTALEKVSQLENVPGELEKSKKAVDNSMEQLHKHLKTLKLKIEAIESSVTKAEESLQQYTSNVESALHNAHNSSIKAINHLNERLTTTVNSSFETIKSVIRSLFAKQKQAELAALESVVTAQLKEIERVIENEKDSGVKGFIKRLNSGIAANLDRSVLTNDTTFVQLAMRVAGYVDPLFEFINEELTPPNSRSATSSMSQPVNPYASKVDKIRSALATLLTRLINGKSKTYNFDTQFALDLSSVLDAVNELSAVKFGEGKHPELLNILRSGMTDLGKELRHAYINAYDKAMMPQVLKNDKLTIDAEKCSKVCLTVISILGLSLTMLKVNCWSLRGQQINRDVDLGKLLAAEGYHVSDRGEQNGELQDKDIMKGDQVHKRLSWPISSAATDHLTTCKPNNKAEKFDILDILRCLSDHLHQYYSVRHYATSSATRQPSNIYEMLCWLIGLPHNPVYPQLSLTGFTDLFEKPKEEKNADNEAGEDIVAIKSLNDLTLEAYPESITVDKLTTTLGEVCSGSNSVLTAILGKGHAGGIYACDFSSNSLKLRYATNMDALICQLSDILKRVYRQLYFLYQQCHYNQKHSGWRDCWYGRYVGGSHWRCNDKQCVTQDCNQKAHQTSNQNANQMCKQHPKCGLKSPLQSFLEDGLPGFMPHTLISEKGKLACSQKNHGNLLCHTPMGFRDISVMASHTNRGTHIYMTLSDFCGGKFSPLTRLCNLFNCLLPSAPKSLDDMFGFLYHLLHRWHDDNNKDRMTHRKEAFNDAVKEACFDGGYDLSEVSLLFTSRRHTSFVYSDNKANNLYHNDGDLYSIHRPEDTCYTANMKCGAYVSPLSMDIHSTLSSKHKALYLSWVVYCTETFYSLLRKLYDECYNNCASANAKCYSHGCYKECLISTGSLFQESQPSTHWPQCSSILDCRMTLPTLYSSGMIFGDREMLEGQVGSKRYIKRTCKDFTDQLKTVIGDTSVLSKIIHKTIPEFLFTIRAPFLWMTVALWSLSLFYLICVMVGRLDVLHIKSHLRIPSSHKITPQSLLAAAQVGRLAKISYLQP
ncbi:hypothetical protein, conserved [Babesia bigemina]|uniref:C3H1-type domain-containing protein n=1 Tax=Babesia bigemina TaxID=5866 RepID=A0A061BJB3_BABBI|nr:hypothetical protein, conserved [Babesia bigemina]CDR71566.1 hypothetical protein, conserved [Babesia bigemina]|eukprot:XP_012770512.1 hypothetical protein, conserved [Babesia bigemina]